MQMCLDGQIKSNMIPKAIGALMSNKMSAMPLWRFFRMNYKRFDEMYVIVKGTRAGYGCVYRH